MSKILRKKKSIRCTRIIRSLSSWPRRTSSSPKATQSKKLRLGTTSSIASIGTDESSSGLKQGLKRRPDELRARHVGETPSPTNLLAKASLRPVIGTANAGQPQHRGYLDDMQGAYSAVICSLLNVKVFLECYADVSRQC